MKVCVSCAIENGPEQRQENLKDNGKIIPMGLSKVK